METEETETPGCISPEQYDGDVACGFVDGNEMMRIYESSGARNLMRHELLNTSNDAADFFVPSDRMSTCCAALP
jgi:hypothetical protein